jgi:uncharacterized lipoprotein YddW (UPF0748 family)
MHSLALALLLAAPTPAPDRPAPELRGLWVVRTALVSAASVDRVVAQAAEGGMNALFVQVRGRGDAFYASSLAPRSTLIESGSADLDPLARLIQRARERGMQVHAWVNVLLAAHFGQPLPAIHVLAVHPEWMMVPRSAAAGALGASPSALPALVLRAARSDPDVEGYYVSPSAPGAREHLEHVVRELVRSYPLDGLHLDFIRYPGPDYDFSRAALEGLRKVRGGTGDLLGGPAADPVAWDAYRRGTLSALADGLARAARFERPGIVISAAVVPDDTLALAAKQQDWPGWLSRHILDAVCPMTYSPDGRLFRRQLERVRALAGAAPVWAGIGAYRLTLAGVVEKVHEARAAGASGVVLFSHESLQGADWRRLREQAFADRPGPAAQSRRSELAEGSGR